MRICLDARSVGSKTCGVSRYARELMAALGRIDRTNEYIVYTRDPVQDLRLPGNFEVKSTGCSRMNPAHDFRVAAILSRDRPSVYHALHAWLPVVMPAGVAAVFTLHDLFAVTDREFFAKRRPLDGVARAYFKRLIRRSLHRAQAVISDSHYSKDEIRRVFPAERVPIAVVHLAPPERSEEGPEIPASLDPIGCPYVLYVGNFRSYKNVETLLRGFAHLLRASGNEDVALVLAGSDVGEAIRQLSAGLGISHAVRFVHRPSDATLRHLYGGASALVQPSLYEGFGLPPLEAMKAGVPVIVSDAACLLEVCGGAARVFPRRDAEALARQLSAVLNTAALRQEMRSAGLVQAARYNWAATAERTLGVYQLAAGARPTRQRFT